MNTAGAVILALVLLLIGAGVGWIIFTRIRASRLGLPPPPLRSYIPFLSSGSTSYGGGPTPAPGGIVGWVNDKIRLMRHRNKRTAAGAYEGPSPTTPYYGGRYAARGNNPSAAPEDDDPWDSRLRGYNPYEEDDDEERQRGSGYGPGGEGYQMNLPVPAPPEEGAASAAGPSGPAGAARVAGSAGAAGAAGAQQGGHDEEEGRRGRTENPFGDDADPSNLSVRGVSPRPTTEGGAASSSSAARSTAREDRDRTSMFREDV
ncbi:hypothetical protein VTG60DRAFT_264 [Thermothelomyces hinnuleus]